MKKTFRAIFSLVLVLALVFTVAACGGKKDDGKKEDDKADAAKVEVKDSLEILTKVWDALPEDNKFFAVGGSFDNNTATENAPGNFGVESAEALDNTLAFPAASVDMIDQAANLMHAMNANTFTMASFHLKDGKNLDTVVKAIDDNIANRQWMCGFPEQLVIATINDDYVITMFGALDLIDAVKAQISTTYPTAVFAIEKNLMEE